MIHIKNATDINGKVMSLNIESHDDVEIDATGLTLLPGLIDPHVHFRTPGQEYKEDWRTASLASVCGGYTTVFDMPNNKPACITKERLADKKAIIDAQLDDAGVPLNYGLYIGADKLHFDEIERVKDHVVGIKVFMGSSTGDLLMDDDGSLDAIFKLGAEHNLLVAVHAEDECMIQERTEVFKGEDDFATHSKIRSPEVAAKAVEKAISLSEKYGTKLHILHTSTKFELDLIAKAKAKGMPVFSEVCPHHLFLNESAYAALKGRAQMNPPLRSEDHRQCLFDAIHDGTIDTIGSDHAPHTIQEKDSAYRTAPSGVPGIETSLALLLNAYNDKLLSLKEIQSLTSERAMQMFNLEKRNDWVLVDLNLKRTVRGNTLKTKCAWSPYENMRLVGWPVYTILNGRVFDIGAIRG